MVTNEARKSQNSNSQTVNDTTKPTDPALRIPWSHRDPLWFTNRSAAGSQRLQQTDVSIIILSVKHPDRPPIWTLAIGL
jgi:hypothetical protein